MPDRPLLTIALPTYNQPERFEKLLENLAPQIRPGIELVVRDDSTNDATAAVVERHQDLPIRYFRGKKEGLDVAVVFLTEEARGTYVWWMGDDTVAPGAIDAVMELLKRDSSISFVFLNSREEDPASAPSFSAGKSRYVPDGEAMIETFSDSLGFISATVFKRDIALGGLAHARTFTGLAFVNLAIVLHVLAEPGMKYYIAEPLVIGGPRPADKPSWYDGFTVFAINLYHIVRSFQGRFRARAMRRMLGKNFHKIWKGIIVARAKGYRHGLGSDAPKVRPLFACYWSYPEFWVALPFLLLPRAVDRVLYRWYRLIWK